MGMIRPATFIKSELFDQLLRWKILLPDICRNTFRSGGFQFFEKAGQSFFCVPLLLIGGGQTVPDGHCLFSGTGYGLWHYDAGKISAYLIFQIDSALFPVSVLGIKNGIDMMLRPLTLVYRQTTVSTCAVSGIISASSRYRNDMVQRSRTQYNSRKILVAAKLHCGF